MKVSTARRLRNARQLLEDAADQLYDALLGADLRYATQEPAWQESEAGLASCRAAQELREAVAALRGIKLPAAEDLG